MARQWRRNSLRYPGYDYSQAGSAAVTICTHERQPLFGQVIDDVMHPSPACVQVANRWEQIPVRFPGVMVDAYIVMPDHLHGILMIGTDPDIPLAIRVGEIVRSFKSAVHADYGKGVRTAGWPRYNGQLWKRDYYDHIIRNDRDLDHTREYIEANPVLWEDETSETNPVKE